jgi:preprotein translocase subunit SecA
MDPLARFDRNDRCWCGTDQKYKRCHGAIRPLSTPGQPVLRDDGDGYV